MTAYPNTVPRYFVIVLIIISLMIVTGIVRIPFRLDQNLKVKYAKTGIVITANSDEETFVGIDEINEEISKVTANREMGDFFKMAPLSEGK